MKSTLKRSADPLVATANLLVLTISEDTESLAGPAAAADEALGGAIARALQDGELTGKAGTATTFHAPTGLGAPRVIVAGIGHGDIEDWRAGGEAVGRRAVALKAERLALAPAEDATPTEVGALLEGIGTGSYRFERFKTGEAPPPVAERISVHSAALSAADLRRADRVVAAVNGARDLVNTPGNHLTPTDLAAEAQRLAEAIPGLECEIIEADRLQAMGAGALLAVAQGSAQAPKLIVLRYTPKRAATEEVLGLVGKAVTFDSGGISIKPSGGMEDMKMDMGGGAAVLHGAALIAALKVPVPVLAVIPSTENMPSGTAVKPGDVITALSGASIEIINTDAEGRLILADALTHAARSGATRLVDMATLTGAVIVAIGEVYAGLFGSDDRWTEAVRQAGERSGDLAWHLPMHPRYDPLIRSKVADLANSSNKRQAGPVYAAQFLREFTEGLPWCHLDIAGTAMPSAGGASGYGVRLILALAEDLAAKGRK